MEPPVAVSKKSELPEKSPMSPRARPQNAILFLISRGQHVFYQNLSGKAIIL